MSNVESTRPSHQEARIAAQLMASGMNPVDAQRTATRIVALYPSSQGQEFAVERALAQSGVTQPDVVPFRVPDNLVGPSYYHDQQARTPMRTTSGGSRVPVRAFTSGLVSPQPRGTTSGSWGDWTSSMGLPYIPGISQPRVPPVTSTARTAAPPTPPTSTPPAPSTPPVSTPSSPSAPASAPSGLRVGIGALFDPDRWSSNIKGWARQAQEEFGDQMRSGADRARLARYFPDLLNSFSSEDPLTGQPTGELDAFLTSALGASRETQWLGESDAIMQLALEAQSHEQFLSTAIQMSFTDRDRFVQLQMALFNHGFMASAPIMGQMDQTTIDALNALILDRWRVGDDQDFGSYLTDKFEAHQQLSLGVLDRSGMTEEEAMELAELEQLRAHIESIDLNAQLSDPAALKDAIQQHAIATLGRQLNESQVAAIVAETHNEERRHYWETSPEVRRYQQLMNQWEDAVANIQGRREGVRQGEATSDLDAFLNALATVESGGDPNALNRDSGTRGLFQFLPATWRATTAAAGLNSNDHSAENQWQAARYLASQYFRQFGNWRDVAIAWYAGPGGVSYSSSAQNRPQYSGGNQYPSIATYADKVIATMAGASTVDMRIDPALLEVEGGPTMDTINTWTTQQLMDWHRTRTERETALRAGIGSMLGGIAQAGRAGAGLGPARSDPTVTTGRDGIDLSRPVAHRGETVDWNLDSFLRNSVREAGGIDTDAWSYAQMANDFMGLLGRRY